jgi:hypothetical protein
VLFFGFLFALSFIVAGWFSALLLIPSIIMAYWLYSDEQELKELSSEIATLKLESANWIRSHPDLLKKRVEGKINCQYLEKGSCASVVNNEEVKAARQADCKNDLETACCYLCSFQNECPISCDYLEPPKKV